ncbi:ABC transporter ATP-binding protein [Paracnuella aquatica]|uniref:ABC transporter ATP-binding protein n=1 Tax=Paracnuella aquatica TaxID=2268757 RepID=UPI001F4DA3D3|nr:ABC transporter ATP-binding protein [Paracnuella aquatica]
MSIAFQTDAGLQPAVQNLNLQVQRGEIVALVGESGSGKSISALSILQLLPVPPAKYTGGQILFSDNGNTAVDLLLEPDMRTIRGAKIGMVFQEPMSALNPVMTVGKQVREVLLAHQPISKKAAQKEVLQWLQQVRLPDPEKTYHKYPHQLSGGQKQRVMIAMAVCCRPSLLICDEPTTALDPTVQRHILELIQELQQAQGMSVLFITHDLGVVAHLAHRVAIMYGGKLLEEGVTAQIFNSPKHPYTRALLACRPAGHVKGERLPAVEEILQQKPTPPAAPLRSPSSRVLMQAKNIHVSFPTAHNIWGKPTKVFNAVQGVSLQVFEGETLGLVGESGCGKTTLGRTLLRLIDPTSGKIFFREQELTKLAKGALHQFRKEVQLVFQDPFSALNPRLSIGDALEEPLLHLEGLNGGKMRRSRVAELLNQVQLPAKFQNRFPHEFSGGQRQRIVIARALAMNPSFLVCDESVSALDVSVQAQVLNLLNDLKAELGLTLLFISHDLEVVRFMSDRIMVMQGGKIVETGSAEQVYHDPKEAYTKELLAAANF